MGIGRLIGTMAGVLLLGSVASAAQAPYLAALGIVEPGQWHLQELRGTARTMCVADPRVLLQIQHGPLACSRFVVVDGPRTATVHYTCPGAGHGRTTISVEGGQRFRLQTQGMLEGAPFDTEYEGKRTGACGGAGSGTAR